MIKVVCGIIRRDQKVFICRRKAQKDLGGYWEFPGGKVEDKESYEKALKRELIEELGMHVEILDHFKTVIYKYPDFTIELIAYNCNFIDATFTMTDHDAFEPVKLQELNNWKLAPADIPIANSLIELSLNN